MENAQTLSRPYDEPQFAVAAKPIVKSRLLYVDNLRTLVIVMVILVHLAVTYGGEGSWYYKEGRADLPTGIVLTFHNAISQSFFMGLLFLLSAYFTAASYDRKGPGPFLRDRFLRLGIPLLIYEFILQPLTVCVLFKAGIYTPSDGAWDYLKQYYTSLHIGSGPLWFVETLLIFSLLYVAWRAIRGRIAVTQNDSGGLPGLAGMLSLGIAMGVVSFVVRQWFTVNWALSPFNLQLAFFVQYIAMFILGVIAYRRNWLQRLPTAMARPCFAIAVLLVVIGMPLLFILGGATSGKTSSYLGGPHWQAFAYAMWEQVFAVAMMVGLIVLFRERFNRQGPVAQAAASSSYTVYIIHTPIIVLFALAMRNVSLYPLLKFAIAALVTIPLTFAIANGVRQLPLARRIL